MDSTSSPRPISSRRDFLRTSATAAVGALLAPSALAADRDWTNANPVRFPDPDIIALDPRYNKYKLGNTPILRLYVGTMWSEGPAWNAVGRYLVWSDIPNDRQLRWIEDDGRVSVFRSPSGNSNGNTFDAMGRQIACEHGNRRMVRYEHNGSVTVLADKFQGKPLNAPNDVIVHPDGGIWFTDPGYGSLLNYEGHKGDLQLKEAVYRIDPKTGAMAKVSDDAFKPNGLCFSPDLKKLYIADTGATHYPNAPKNILVCDVIDGVKLGKAREFASMKMKVNGAEVAGLADGIRADIDGNLWVAGGWVGDGYDGVHTFTPEGERIGLIKLPEIASNVCFGGTKRNRLFITAGQSLYAVYVETQGAA